MKEYKNIDRLFQEKFRDFEQNPSSKVWNNIENTLSGKPRKDRRAVWLWLSGVAAGLAVLFFINSPFFNTITPQKNTNQSEIVTTPIEKTVLKQSDTPQEKKYNNTTKTINNNQITNTNTTSLVQIDKIINPSEKENSKNETSTASLATKTLPKTLNKTITLVPSDERKEIAQTGLLPQKEITSKIEPITNNKTTTSIDKNLTENNSETEDKSSNKKWAIATVAAPIYLSSFDKNSSSIDPQFNNNIKQGSFSAAYGVQIAYQFNNRFTLQSGIHVIDYGYKTYGVYVSPSGAINQYSNINYNDNANLINVNAVPLAQPSQFDETNLQETKGDLTQVFGYIEIPLEAKYRLNKGNLGINLVGGFSTLLLNKNEIFIETDEFSNKLGEATNLNSLNFSGNLGLELEYKLYKNVNFSLVPMVKVHTNTYNNNTGGFSPYAIGVYSGLNLRF